MLSQLINIINTFGITNSYHRRPLPQSPHSHRVVAAVLVSSHSSSSCRCIVQSTSSSPLHRHWRAAVAADFGHPPPVHHGKRAGWHRVVTWHGRDLRAPVVRAPCFRGVAQQSGGPCRLGREVGGLVNRRGIVGQAVEAVVMAWQHPVSMNSDTKKKGAPIDGEPV